MSVEHFNDNGQSKNDFSDGLFSFSQRILWCSYVPVSYTHLDVYKRQLQGIEWDLHDNKRLSIPVYTRSKIYRKYRGWEKYSFSKDQRTKNIQKSVSTYGVRKRPLTYIIKIISSSVNIWETDCVTRCCFCHTTKLSYVDMMDQRKNRWEAQCG